MQDKAPSQNAKNARVYRAGLAKKLGRLEVIEAKLDRIAALVEQDRQRRERRLPELPRVPEELPHA